MANPSRRPRGRPRNMDLRVNLKTCKRPGCLLPPAKGQAYCCKEHAPFGGFGYGAGWTFGKEYLKVSNEDVAIEAQPFITLPRRGTKIVTSVLPLEQFKTLRRSPRMVFIELDNGQLAFPFYRIQWRNTGKRKTDNQKNRQRHRKTSNPFEPRLFELLNEDSNTKNRKR